MNIYHILRKDQIGWDEYDAHIVAAHTAEECRNLIPRGCENSEVWQSATIRIVGQTHFEKPQVLLSSYIAG